MPEVTRFLGMLIRLPRTTVVYCTARRPVFRSQLPAISKLVGVVISSISSVIMRVFPKCNYFIPYMYMIKVLIVVCIIFAGFAAAGHAATLPPKSGIGGLPHQEPLQPLPQGVGANISNNIQQTDSSGPPASATTVIPIDENEEASEIGGVEAAGLSEASASSGQSGFSRGVVWILVIVGVIGFIVWLRRSVNKQVS